MFENVKIALSNSNIYNLSNKLINSIINNQHHFHIEVNYQEDNNGQPIEIGNSTGWWFEFIIMNCYKIKFKVNSSTTFSIYMADVDSEYSSSDTLSIGSPSNLSIQYFLIQNPDFSFPDSNCEYTLLAFGTTSNSTFSSSDYHSCFTIRIKDEDTNNYTYFYSNKFSKARIYDLLNNGIVKYDNKYIMNINTIFNFNYDDGIINIEAIINDGYMSDIQCKYNILSTSNLSYGYHYEMNTNKYFSLTNNILLLYE